jgi:hypothetical protein
MSQRNERLTQPVDGVTFWLIHHAAGRAPEDLSSRLEEEWLADADARSSALSRLRFAAGCCWASVVIAHDFSRNQVPAAGSEVSARGVITTVADGNFGYFSLRPGTLFVIVGLHAALFFGLIATLAHTNGVATPSYLQNHVVTPAVLVE